MLARQDLTSLLRVEWKPVAFRLMHSSHLTRSQYNYVRQSLTIDDAPLLPDYSTIQRYWKRQDLIEPHQPDLMAQLASGIRVLLSKTNDKLHISIGNRLQWMLFLLSPVIRSLRLINGDGPAVLELPLFLWYDGAPISKRRQGLFSALKVSDLRLKDSSGVLIPLPAWLIKKTCGRSWTLSLSEESETSNSLLALESQLLSEWETVHQLPPFEYQGITLHPTIEGVTADHGSRSKIMKRNSLEERCGECNFVLCSQISTYFLDWTIISSTVLVTSANWSSVRYQDPPPHLHMWNSTQSSDFASYDNHHSVVGHIKNLYSMLMCLVPPSDLPHLYVELQRVSRVHHPEGKKDPTLRFKGFHWRKASLHFKEIFNDVWAEEVRESFSVLFELLKEIHIFNYIDWNRRSEGFADLRARYLCVLFCYTLQLKVLFDSTRLAMLNTLYLHKMLVHSVQLFRRANMSSSSCEQGEGKISCVNRDLTKTNSDLNGSLRKVFITMIVEEEDDFLECDPRDKPSSRHGAVFEDNAIESFIPKELTMKLSRDKCRQLQNALKWADCPSIIQISNQSKMKIVNVPVPSAMLGNLGDRPDAVVPQSKLKLRLQVFGRLVREVPISPKIKQSNYMNLVTLTDKIRKTIEEKDSETKLIGRGLFGSTTAHLDQFQSVLKAQVLSDWPMDETSLESIDDVLNNTGKPWESQFEVEATNKDSTRLRKANARGRLSLTLAYGS